MRFFAPLWLWGLLLLPILYFGIVYDEKRREKQFLRFAAKKVWPWIAPELNPGYRVRKACLGLAAGAFALLALARPQWGTHEESVQVAGLDIMLALDVSSSMNVEDVVPSRLQKAKHLIRTIVNQLDGDRMGVVAFAGSSYVACPLTTDLSYLWDTVQILGPKVIQNQGTDIGIGLQTALNALERGGEEVKVANSTVIPSHIVILISDGEDHEQDAIVAASKLKEKGTKLYVLGVGTSSGGPIPIKDETGNAQGFKKDRTGQTIVSTFHSDFLMKVAQAGDGKYWNVTPGETEVHELLEDLKGLTRGDYAERKFVVYEERFQIPLALAILCLILQLSVPTRKILTLFLFLASPLVRAGEPLRASPSWDAYSENKKGIEAYQQGNIDEAEKSFGAAQARDPNRPELEFNRGTVEMQKGNIDRAIESFKGTVQSAYDSKNLPLLGKSFYNLGNALTKKGDIQNAVGAYLGAINSAAKAKDQKLEYEARKNLQLLVDQVKQQKQQEDQKKEQENKEKEKKEEQTQNQESSKNKDQKNQGQKDQDKKGQNPKDNQDKPGSYKETSKEDRKRQFQSKKMKPEDADRVMSELTAKERELQEKIQSQNAKSQDNSKDW